MQIVQSGVGRVRTEAFEVDKFLPIYPKSKAFFNPVENLRKIESVSNDIINAKRKALEKANITKTVV